MYLKRVSLQNFRNFVELEVDLSKGRTVFFGSNAQGKTNLLEAMYMFATAKSVRAGHEREVINWNALNEEIPFARAVGAVERADGPLRVEIVLQLARFPGGGVDTGDESGFQFQKRIRIDGVPRRASDLVGQMNAVLFAPQDIELVHGSPSTRRRYLDITLCQVDRPLLHRLQHYAKVLAERNSLLKSIREGRAGTQELAFWDQQLVDTGALIIEGRLAAMDSLAKLARSVHRDLTGGAEELDLRYAPSLEIKDGADLRLAFRQALEELRSRELRQAVSLVGPHRDDFRFYVNDRELATFGSRGQQRTASLSLKLAEARFMAGHRGGDQPVLLLDDVFSELDSFRQGYLLSWIADWDQAILTTAEPMRMDRRLVAGAAMLEVAGGQVRRLGEPPHPGPGQ